MKRPARPGFWLVWARECRFIRRDRLAPILIFGVPLLAYIALTAIFSNQVIRGLGVVVIDHDRSQTSATLIQAIAASPNLKSTMAKAGVQGGVANDVAITPGFGAQVHASGLRPGHYRAFINLLRHAYLWDKARERYGEIKIPVLVVYGDRDWSREDERQRTVKAIPGAKMETVANAGHFLSLDQPERLAELIKSFTAANASQATQLGPDDRM